MPRKRPALLFLVLIGLLFSGSVAEASVVRQTYEFSTPTLAQQEGVYDVTLAGAWSYGAPGEPILPLAGVQLLLPPGESVTSIEIVPGERVLLPGQYRVRSGEMQYPLSYKGPATATPPDAAIYASRAPYPGKLRDVEKVGFFRGYQIASFALHPVEYIPATGELAYYASLEVVITTAPDAGVLATNERMIRTDQATIGRLARIVDNPEAGEAYAHMVRAPHESRSLDPELAYKYIIITTDEWYTYMPPFAVWQTERGHKARAYSTSWIFDEYNTGVDDQDNIRDFIIDAYQTWDIDYVLLVGDARDELGIPHRGLYSTTAYFEEDDDIPADMYYGCLDGNWNTDGDARWGEPGEDDLYHEVGVGRLCIDSVTELDNLLNKICLYCDMPIVGECDEALMAGELLWSDPTWGGDYKDEIKNGASTHGYTTAGFPATMNVGTLYDRTATWSKSQLIDLMENGMNIVNHLGHCNVTYAMKMDNPDIASFDNNGVNHSLNFVYSQGCYCGSMDNRDPYGSYTSDCFAEQFTAHSAGAVAVIMNSRYGWGEHMSTNGSSQYYDREFFDAFFAEGIYPVADANDDSKMDNIWALSYGANRWCYYQLNVFGDPAMHLWTAEPEPLTVEHPDVVLIGQPDLVITVNDAGGPVEGAQVTIWTHELAVYETGFTNALGEVTLHPNAENVATLNIQVTAHDRLNYAGEMPIIAPDGPYLVISEVQYYDTGGDGLVQAGESVQMRVMLRNVGIAGATGINATISCADENIELTNATQTFPDLGPDASAWCDGFYAFDVAPLCPDQAFIQMPMVIAGEERLTWDSQISFMVHAPMISIAEIVIDDTVGGDGNYRLDAGETATIAITLLNSGSGRLDDITGDFTCSHPLIAIDSGTATISGLGEDETGLLEPIFAVTIDPDFQGYDALFDLTLAGSNSYACPFPLEFTINGFYETVENGAGEWTHEAITGGFTDAWHISAQRNHSLGGSQSWKCGDVGSGDYPNLLDAGLVTPAVNIDDGELRFWMWIDAEESSYYSGRAYDGGLVEMSLDGGAYAQITPVGGYTHTIRAGSVPGPFPEETPVFSGQADWQEVVFDLSDVTGSVSFRFRFGSDGADTREGWYIDDIEILGLANMSGAEEERLAVDRVVLMPSRPNPTTGQTRISFALPEAGEAHLAVYDTNGRLVRTLMNGELAAGLHRATWDGADALGHPAASGLYFYRLQTTTGDQQRSLVLLR